MVWGSVMRDRSWCTVGVGRSQPSRVPHCERRFPHPKRVGHVFGNRVRK
jgi:hypothetical protein